MSWLALLISAGAAVGLTLAGCSTVSTTVTPAAYIRGDWNCTIGTSSDRSKYNYLIGRDSISIRHGSLVDFFTYSVAGSELTVHQLDGNTTWTVDLPKALHYGERSRTTAGYHQQDPVPFLADARSLKLTVPERSDGLMKCSRTSSTVADQSSPEQAAQTLLRATQELDCDAAFAVATPTVLSSSTCADFARVFMQTVDGSYKITATKELTATSAEVAYSYRQGTSSGKGKFHLIKRRDKWFIDSATSA